VPKHTLRVTGPTARGQRISGPLLRDLLGMVAEGASRALRMRVEGRSTSAGPKPSWLESGSGFDFLGLASGSTVVSIDAPPVAEADPTAFAQGSMFLDNKKTAIQFWHESLADALKGETDSELFDQSMLADFKKWLRQLFSHDVTELQISNGTASTTPLVVQPEGINQIEYLERQTPNDRRVRVSGKLDVIRHSDRRLTLNLTSGAALTCWADEIDPDTLRSMSGDPVVIEGVAVFRPSGKVLRVEGEQIKPATQTELELWSGEPEPIESELDVNALRKPQGPRSGINAIFGKWPGDETDEEFEEILKDMS
jgi:hypothetical protein